MPTAPMNTLVYFLLTANLRDSPRKSRSSVASSNLSPFRSSLFPKSVSRPRGPVVQDRPRVLCHDGWQLSADWSGGGRLCSKPLLWMTRARVDGQKLYVVCRRTDRHCICVASCSAFNFKKSLLFTGQRKEREQPLIDQRLNGYSCFLVILCLLTTRVVAITVNCTSFHVFTCRHLIPVSQIFPEAPLHRSSEVT